MSLLPSRLEQLVHSCGEVGRGATFEMEPLPCGYRARACVESFFDLVSWGRPRQTCRMQWHVGRPAPADSAMCVEVCETSSRQIIQPSVPTALTRLPAEPNAPKAMRECLPIYTFLQFRAFDVVVFVVSVSWSQILILLAVDCHRGIICIPCYVPSAIPYLVSSGARSGQMSASIQCRFQARG